MVKLITETVSVTENAVIVDYTFTHNLCTGNNMYTVQAKFNGVELSNDARGCGGNGSFRFEIPQKAGRYKLEVLANAYRFLGSKLPDKPRVRTGAQRKTQNVTIQQGEASRVDTFSESVDTTTLQTHSGQPSGYGGVAPPTAPDLPSTVSPLYVLVGAILLIIAFFLLRR